MTEEVEPATITPEDARALTDTLRQTVDVAWDLVTKLYETQAWAVLGYGSWDAYCEAELGTVRLRLPRDKRGAVVTALRAAGLSQRSIGAATGLSKGTIGRELAAAPNGAPESVVGADGKTYPASRADGFPTAELDAIFRYVVWRRERAWERLDRLEASDVENMTLDEARACMAEARSIREALTTEDQPILDMFVDLFRSIDEAEARLSV